jgi:hypothetical protein
MTNPLKHVHELGGVSEAYEVVRTAVVVLDGHTYRIEVLKGYLPPATAYTARCAVLRQVPAQVLASATPPTDGSTDDTVDDTVTVWVEHPFSPPVAGDRPKQVLADALSRLTATRPSDAVSSPRPRTRRRAPIASSTKG